MVEYLLRICGTLGFIPNMANFVCVCLHVFVCAQKLKKVTTLISVTHWSENITKDGERWAVGWSLAPHLPLGCALLLYLSHSFHPSVYPRHRAAFVNTLPPSYTPRLLCSSAPQFAHLSNNQMILKLSGHLQTSSDLITYFFPPCCCVWAYSWLACVFSMSMLVSLYVEVLG